MPNVLSNLTVREISLVDRPANSSTVNGKRVPRARVALWKRDSEEDEDRVIKSSQGEEETMPMTLEDITKKVESQEVILKALTSDNDVLKAENEAVMKM